MMRDDLRLTRAQHDTLIAHLLPDSDEHAAALICGVRGDDTLVCREVICLGEADLEDSTTSLHLDVSPHALARIAKRALAMLCSVVVCHSHPFSGRVRASWIDLATEAELCGRVLYRRVGNRQVGALVVGPDGYDGGVWRAGDRTVLSLVVDGVRVPAHGATASRANDVDDAYARQALLWGAAGQDVLRGLRVGIVGLGGTGSHVATQLAHLGVGELWLVDHDDVETTNLSRIIGAGRADVGQPKVDVTRRNAERINPDIVCRVFYDSILDMDAAEVAACDVLVCCTDSHGSRALLTELAAQYLVPLIDLGVEVQPGNEQSRAGGGVRVVRPGDPCLHCAGILDPAVVRQDFLSGAERDAEARLGYLRGVGMPAPSVIALNGVVASLAVVELLDLVLGLFATRSRRVLFRAEARAVTTAAVDRDARCYVCGDDGVIGVGDARRLPRIQEQPRTGT